jgi:hypothetical protein
MSALSCHLNSTLAAYERGRIEKRSNLLRISPYYEERVIIDGRSVDITGQLDRYWYAGYDGLPMPKEGPA